MFLWFVERKKEKYWQDDSFAIFENNLKELILHVAEKIEAKNIPHYFIRKLNLFPPPGLKTLLENSTKYDLKGVAKYIRSFTKKEGFSK